MLSLTLIHVSKIDPWMQMDVAGNHSAMSSPIIILTPVAHIYSSAAANRSKSSWMAPNYTIIPAWLSNYTYCKVLGEITYLLPNLNSYKVWDEIPCPF